MTATGLGRHRVGSLSAVSVSLLFVLRREKKGHGEWLTRQAGQKTARSGRQHLLKGCNVGRFAAITPVIPREKDISHASFVRGSEHAVLLPV